MKMKRTQYSLCLFSIDKNLINSKFILIVLLLLSGSIYGASANSKVIIKGLPQVVCTSPLSYYVDNTRKVSFKDLKHITFSKQTAQLSKEFNYNRKRVNYWIKFSLKNTDSTSTVAYLDASSFGKLRVYKNISGQITVQNAGYTATKNSDISPPQLFMCKLLLPPKTTVQFVLFWSKTGIFDDNFQQIDIYGKQALYNEYYREYYNMGSSRLVQILFLGFMFSQILLVIFSRVMGIKRKEFLYYIIYLVLVTSYYILKNNEIIGLYWPFDYYPGISLYTESILLALPFVFYIKFIRYFLDLKKLDVKAFARLLNLEYFIVIYVIIDTALRFFITSIDILNGVLMVVIFGIFIYGLTIIIPLVKYKKILVNLILTGSIVAGLGGVLGMLISLLRTYLGIWHTKINVLISGQIGIVIETVIFTASLVYKSRITEREKIAAQKKLITQLRENKLLREKMEKTRDKIARDLHDDIGSTLSSILLFSNAAKTKKIYKNGDAIKIFKKISKLAENMIDAMSDIIWVINPRQDSMSNILKRMRYYAAPIANAQNMELDFKAEKEIPDIYLDMEKRKDLYLIFKECIINAAKYSKGTCVSVRIYTLNKNLFMEIEDNGVGISGNHDNGNGLNNMKKRAENSGGQLEINSIKNKGTAIKAMFPL